MSFEKVEYDFDKKCYIILGANAENEGQNSNGSGKTSFVDIIAIVLLGDSLTERNLKNCVNWSLDIDSFTVIGEFENKEYDLHLSIERKIYSKSKSSELVILLNGKVPSIPTKQGVKNGVDIKAGNEYILKEIFDIKKQDILNYFLISKDYYQPFLQVNTDKKLEVIGRFTNTDVVDKAISSLENEIKDDETTSYEFNLTLSKIQGSIEVLNHSLSEEFEKAFNEKKELDVDRLESKISNIISEIENVEKEKCKLQNDLLSLKLEDIDLNEVAKLRSDLLEIDREIEAFEFQEKSTIKKIKDYENWKLGLIQCPNCNHEFSPTSSENFTDSYFENLKLKKNEFEAVFNELRELRASVKSSIEEVSIKERKNNQIKSESSSINRNIESINKQQERLLTEIDRLTIEKESILSKTFADEKADIAEQIREKENEYKFTQIRHQELIDKLSEKKKWVDLFSDFKFYLGNKPIEAICALVNQYLKLNGSDLNVHIEGFKKLKSGEIRQALNPIIYRNWMNPKEFSSFSAGEKARLNLSVDLAFQQLINSASKYGGLDLYINDEILNPLDSSGIKNAAEAFNELNKTIMLVSHSGADLNYQNTITIEKKNGISKIL